MRNILQIHKPKNSQHILWEHLMKTAIAFTGTFALLFFGPMFMSAKNHSDSNLGLEIMLFMTGHPTIQIGICVLVVIIYNIAIVFKNFKKNYLVRIDIDENIAHLGLSNLYYKNIEQYSVNLEDLDYEIKTKTSDNGEKNTTLKFIDNKTNKTIAIIKPSYIIWNNQIQEIKQSMLELNKLGINKRKRNITNPSVIGSVFKR